VNGLAESRRRLGSSSSKSGYVLPETTLLAVIGGIDLLSTIYIIATNRGHEANPLFAYVLETMGPTGFVLAKALLLGVPLTVAELARKRHDAFVRRALRIAIVGYISLYVLTFVRYNVGVLVNSYWVF